MSLDATDRRIMRALQRDATTPIAELAAAAGLSQTPCWKRVKRLEAEGYIAARVALIDRDKVGLGVTVFVAVKTSRHDDEWLKTFAASIKGVPEVTEFYRMSGDVDYLLKVVCADIADYDRIYKKIIAGTRLFDVSSSFAMEQIKSTTELPI